MYADKTIVSSQPNHIQEAEGMANMISTFSPSHQCDMLDCIIRELVGIADKQISELGDERTMLSDKIHAREILITYMNKEKEYGIKANAMGEPVHYKGI
jgi:hypothetical protein